MVEPVIKWSGSKRLQASAILSYFPDTFNVYYEPFIGGGSIMGAVEPLSGVCGDTCKPLIDLWSEIKNRPALLADEYQKRWQRMKMDGYSVYYDIRDSFNKTRNPFDLLFLSRTCVNGLIRFNSSGNFNNSLHYSRSGINPDRLKRIIFDWSKKVQNVRFENCDYRKTTQNAKKGDLIYLDPPYFHTKGRYSGNINFEEFIAFLDDLNKRGVKFLLSYDGIRGENDYTVHIPKELYRQHILIPSGKSTFRKVQDKKSEDVKESLYMNF